MILKKDKMSQIYYYQLALENYEDLTGNKLNYLSSTQNKLRELRKNINVWNENIKNEQINQILTEFKAAVEKTEKENYTCCENLIYTSYEKSESVNQYLDNVDDNPSTGEVQNKYNNAIIYGNEEFYNENR